MAGSRRERGSPDRDAPGQGGAEEEALKVLIIDDHAERTAILEQGLAEAGYTRVMAIGTTGRLAERIQALDPDVVIIDLESPDRDTLEAMFAVSRAVQRPIAMFVDQSDRAAITAAIEAGVSAYVVDGLRKERVWPIVEVAISRFESFTRLQRERDEARARLNERVVIERAKGLLMEKRAVSEATAYASLRTAAMRSNRRLLDVAEEVIRSLTAEPDKPGRRPRAEARPDDDRQDPRKASPTPVPTQAPKERLR